MPESLFSVIIPTYNRAESLEKTLLCILNQTYQRFEIIIIDDGGNDNSKAMVDELNDDRLKYSWQENQGPLIARYFGAKKASSPWIAFCDSDDLWQPEYLMECKIALESTGAKLCFGDYQVEGENEPRLKILNREGFFAKSTINDAENFKILDAKLFYKTLMVQQPLMISAFVISRDYYNSIGGIDPDLNVIGSEDAHLTQRAVGNTEHVVFLKRNLVQLGRGTDNVSASYIRNLEGGLEILNDISNRQLVKPILLGPTKDSALRHKLELAKQTYWHGQYKKSAKHLFSMLNSPRYYLIVSFIFFKIITKGVVCFVARRINKKN
ncbi:glycosyltransferase [Alishewanella sp. WH16-1]|uniref:glycosyltransferase family 2 protein n=1 Tax=Alishewanella sp. WH16-1 TaxID=1651088 RepID=UPI000710E99A|nr:glycosyltransferase [Alishewanella sp. WH16-1]